MFLVIIESKVRLSLGLVCVEILTTFATKIQNVARVALLLLAGLITLAFGGLKWFARATPFPALLIGLSLLVIDTIILFLFSGGSNLISIVVHIWACYAIGIGMLSISGRNYKASGSEP